MPKVLISDSMSNVAQKIFEKNNIAVDVKTGLSEDEIIKIIPEYDGMVVRSATKVTKKILDAASNLKVIGRALPITFKLLAASKIFFVTLVADLTTIPSYSGIILIISSSDKPVLTSTAILFFSNIF